MADPSTHDHFIAARVAWGPLIFQAARCARDMGVLEAVSKEALTPSQVASKTGVSYYAARVLLEGCAAAELVKQEGETYRLTGAGEVLRNDALTTVNLNFVHDVCYQGAFYLRESLDEARPAGLKEIGNADWHTVYQGLTQLAPQVQKSWFAFDHFYSDPIFRHALKLLAERKTKRILDVGGNTGRFACQAAKAASVTVLDHPAQLKIATENAAKAGVTLTPHPIDLLDHSLPFPKPFDAVWMSQLVDCFPETDIVGLMKRGKDALAAEGRLYVLEPLWDRQPHDLARYNVQATSLYFSCIANGTSRMYAADDLIRCAQEAGLKVETDMALGPWHTLFAFVPT